MISIVILLAWVLIGIVTAGRAYAYFQRNWPDLATDSRSDDIRMCLLLCVAGPIGAFAVELFLIGKPRHGWLFPGIPYSERPEQPPVADKSTESPTEKKDN